MKGIDDIIANARAASASAKAEENRVRDVLAEDVRPAVQGVQQTVQRVEADLGLGGGSAEPMAGEPDPPAADPAAAGAEAVGLHPLAGVTADMRDPTPKVSVPEGTTKGMDPFAGDAAGSEQPTAFGPGAPVEEPGVGVGVGVGAGVGVDVGAAEATGAPPEGVQAQPAGTQAGQKPWEPRVPLNIPRFGPDGREVVPPPEEVRKLTFPIYRKDDPNDRLLLGVMYQKYGVVGFADAFLRSMKFDQNGMAKEVTRADSERLAKRFATDATRMIRNTQTRKRMAEELYGHALRKAEQERAILAERGVPGFAPRPSYTAERLLDPKMGDTIIEDAVIAGAGGSAEAVARIRKEYGTAAETILADNAVDVLNVPPGDRDAAKAVIKARIKKMAAAPKGGDVTPDALPDKVASFIDQLGGPEQAQALFDADEGAVDLLAEAIASDAGIDTKSPVGKLKLAQIKASLSNAEFDGAFGPLAIYKKREADLAAQNAAAAAEEERQRALAEAENMPLEELLRDVPEVRSVARLDEDTARVMAVEVKRLRDGIADDSAFLREGYDYMYGTLPPSARILPWDEMSMRNKMLFGIAGREAMLRDIRRAAEAPKRVAEIQKRIEAAKNAGPAGSVPAALRNAAAQGGHQMLAGLFEAPMFANALEKYARSDAPAGSDTEKALRARVINAWVELQDRLASIAENPTSASGQTFLKDLASKSEATTDTLRGQAGAFAKAVAENPSGAAMFMAEEMARATPEIAAIAGLALLTRGVGAGAVLGGGAAAEAVGGLAARAGLGARGVAAARGAASVAPVAGAQGLAMIPRAQFLAFQEYAADQGVRIDDPTKLVEALADPDVRRKLLDAKDDADKYGKALGAATVAAIVGLGALSAAASGVGPKSRVGRRAAGVGKEAAVGAGTEAAAQFAATGTTNPADIVAEAAFGVTGAVGGEGGAREGTAPQAGATTEAERVLRDALRGEATPEQVAAVASEQPSDTTVRTEDGKTVPAHDVRFQTDPEYDPLDKALVAIADSGVLAEYAASSAEVGMAASEQGGKRELYKKVEAASGEADAAAPFVMLAGTDAAPPVIAGPLSDALAGLKRGVKPGDTVRVYLPFNDDGAPAWDVTAGLEVTSLKGGNRDVRPKRAMGGSEWSATYKVEADDNGAPVLALQGVRPPSRRRILSAPSGPIRVARIGRGTTSASPSPITTRSGEHIDNTKASIDQAVREAQGDVPFGPAAAEAADTKIPGGRVLSAKLGALSVIRDAAMAEMVWSGAGGFQARGVPTLGTIRTAAIAGQQLGRLMNGIVRNNPAKWTDKAVAEVKKAVRRGDVAAAREIVAEVDASSLSDFDAGVRKVNEGVKGALATDERAIGSGVSLSDVMSRVTGVPAIGDMLDETVSLDDLSGEGLILSRDAKAIAAWRAMTSAVIGGKPADAAAAGAQLMQVLSEAFTSRIRSMSGEQFYAAMRGRFGPVPRALDARIQAAFADVAADDNVGDAELMEMEAKAQSRIDALLERLNTPGDPLTDHLGGRTLSEYINDILPFERDDGSVEPGVLSLYKRAEIVNDLRESLELATRDFLNGVDAAGPVVDAISEVPAAVTSAMNAYVEPLFETRLAIDRLGFLTRVVSAIADIEQKIGGEITTGALTDPLARSATVMDASTTRDITDKATRIPLPATATEIALDLLRKNIDGSAAPHVDTAAAVLDGASDAVIDIDAVLDMVAGLDVPIVHSLFALGQALRDVPQLHNEAAAARPEYDVPMPNGAPRVFDDMVEAVKASEAKDVADRLRAVESAYEKEWTISSDVIRAIYGRASAILNEIVASGVTNDGAIEAATKAEVAPSEVSREVSGAADPDRADPSVTEVANERLRDAIENNRIIPEDIRNDPVGVATALADVFTPLMERLGIKGYSVARLGAVRSILAATPDEGPTPELAAQLAEAIGMADAPEPVKMDAYLQLLESLDADGESAGIMFRPQGYDKVIIGIDDGLSASDVARVLRHEMAHALIGAALGTSVGKREAKDLVKAYKDMLLSLAAVSDDLGRVQTAISAADKLASRMAPEDHAKLMEIVRSEAFSKAKTQDEVTALFDEKLYDAITSAANDQEFDAIFGLGLEGKIKDLDLTFPDDFLSTNSGNQALDDLVRAATVTRTKKVVDQDGTERFVSEPISVLPHPAEWLADIVSSMVLDVSLVQSEGAWATGVRRAAKNVRDSFGEMDTPLWARDFNDPVSSPGERAARIIRSTFTSGKGTWRSGVLAFMSRAALGLHGNARPADAQAIQVMLADAIRSSGVTLQVVRNQQELANAPAPLRWRPVLLTRPTTKYGSPTVYVNAMASPSARFLAHMVREELAAGIGLHAVFGRQFGRLVSMLGAGMGSRLTDVLRWNSSWGALRRRAIAQLNEERRALAGAGNAAPEPTAAEIGSRMLQLLAEDENADTSLVKSIARFLQGSAFAPSPSEVASLLAAARDFSMSYERVSAQAELRSGTAIADTGVPAIAELILPSNKDIPQPRRATARGIFGTLQTAIFGDDLPLQVLRRFAERSGLVGLADAARSLVEHVERGKATISAISRGQQHYVKAMNDAINTAAARLGGEAGADRVRVVADINTWLIASHAIERNINHALLYGDLGDDKLNERRAEIIADNDVEITLLLDRYQAALRSRFGTAATVGTDEGAQMVARMREEVKAVRDRLHEQLMDIAMNPGRHGSELRTTKVAEYLTASAANEATTLDSKVPWHDVSGMSIGRARKLLAEIEGANPGFRDAMRDANVQGAIGDMRNIVEFNLFRSGLLGVRGMLFATRYNYDNFVPMQAIDKMPLDRSGFGGDEDADPTPEELTIMRQEAVARNDADMIRRVNALSRRLRRRRRRIKGQTRNTFADRALAPLNEYISHRKLKGPPAHNISEAMQAAWEASVQGAVINNANRSLKDLARAIVANGIGYNPAEDSEAITAPVAVVADGLSAIEITEGGQMGINREIANLRSNQYVVADKQGTYAIVEVRDPDIIRFVESRFSEPTLVTQTVGRYTRFVSSLATRWNPVFSQFRGLLRDMQEAGLHLASSVDGFGAAEVSAMLRRVAEYGPLLHSFFQSSEEKKVEILKAALSDRAHPMHMFAKRMDGGHVQFFIEQLDALAMPDDEGARYKVTQALSAIGSRLEGMADASEQMVRQAAFDTLYEVYTEKHGMSAQEAFDRAARDTRALLNYNQQSAVGRFLAPLFPFAQVALNANRAVLGRWIWKNGEAPVRQVRDSEGRVVEVIDWNEVPKRINHKMASGLVVFGFLSGLMELQALEYMTGRAFDDEELERKKKEILRKIRAESSKAEPSAARLSELKRELAMLDVRKTVFDRLVSPTSFMNSWFVPVGEQSGVRLPAAYGLMQFFSAFGKGAALVSAGRDPGDVINGWIKLQMINLLPLNVPFGDSKDLGRDMLSSIAPAVLDPVTVALTGHTVDGYPVTGSSRGPSAAAEGAARFRFNDNQALRDAALWLTEEMGAPRFVSQGSIRYIAGNFGGVFGRGFLGLLDAFQNRKTGLDTRSVPVQFLDSIGLGVDAPLRSAPVRAYYSVIGKGVFTDLRTEAALVLPGDNALLKRARRKSLAEWKRSGKAEILASYNSITGRVSREEGDLKRTLEGYWLLYKQGRISKQELAAQGERLRAKRDALYLSAASALEGLASAAERLR